MFFVGADLHWMKNGNVLQCKELLEAHALANVHFPLSSPRNPSVPAIHGPAQAADYGKNYG
jgi:hypothetical protein